MIKLRASVNIQGNAITLNRKSNFTIGVLSDHCVQIFRFTKLEILRHLNRGLQTTTREAIPSGRNDF